jgi:hypothetical protein
MQDAIHLIVEEPMGGRLLVWTAINSLHFSRIMTSWATGRVASGYVTSPMSTE